MLSFTFSRNSSPHLRPPSEGNLSRSAHCISSAISYFLTNRGSTKKFLNSRKSPAPAALRDCLSWRGPGADRPSQTMLWSIPITPAPARPCMVCSLQPADPLGRSCSARWLFAPCLL